MFQSWDIGAEFITKYLSWCSSCIWYVWRLSTCLAFYLLNPTSSRIFDAMHGIGGGGRVCWKGPPSQHSCHLDKYFFIAMIHSWYFIIGPPKVNYAVRMICIFDVPDSGIIKITQVSHPSTALKNLMLFRNLLLDWHETFWIRGYQGPPSHILNPK